MNQIKKLSLVLAALVFMLALVPAGMAQAKKPLRNEIDYVFVGFLGIVDDEGRLLLWQGTISGDINGAIRWWGVPGTPTTGQVFHFIERWEICPGEICDDDDLVLLLAGDDAGTTTIRHGKNSAWRTNGIVTEASGGYQSWIGRNVHESGHFTWQVIDTPDGPVTIPESGSGIFRVN